MPLKTFSKHRIMQNRSEPCIWDKYPCQSGTDRQKGGVFAYICALCASGRERGRESRENERLHYNKARPVKPLEQEK